MPVSFGNGSWVDIERQSWNMWYPWPPFFQSYRNEPGLRIHLSPQDSERPGSALGSALGQVTARIASALGAFAGLIPTIDSRLVQNADGSMDIRMSEHGFQVGNAPAGDPNVWLNGAWTPVAAALRRLPKRIPGKRAQPSPAGPSVMGLGNQEPSEVGVEFEVEAEVEYPPDDERIALPPVDATSRGLLVEAESSEESEPDLADQTGLIRSSPE